MLITLKYLQCWSLGKKGVLFMQTEGNGKSIKIKNLTDLAELTGLSRTNSKSEDWTGS